METNALKLPWTLLWVHQWCISFIGTCVSPPASPRYADQGVESRTESGTLQLGGMTYGQARPSADNAFYRRLPIASPAPSRSLRLQRAGGQLRSHPSCRRLTTPCVHLHIRTVASQFLYPRLRSQFSAPHLFLLLAAVFLRN